jgi:hypothetical protein
MKIENTNSILAEISFALTPDIIDKKLQKLINTYIQKAEM